ncbi:basic proline-rich protein-like [Aquila chrysaetos chrysaetos]|uniref:basic proline-rich protein-like n=1 Tax=Aquila chrysaetos chrysaetos TaxID=223781 RepID=UPI001B7D411E|nr:basic proline-rich protein-like [Aquila chrysaetos chrysaetos]
MGALGGVRWGRLARPGPAPPGPARPGQARSGEAAGQAVHERVQARQEGTAPAPSAPPPAELPRGLPAAPEPAVSGRRAAASAAGLLPSPPDTGTTAYRSEIFVAEVYLNF